MGSTHLHLRAIATTLTFFIFLSSAAFTPLDNFLIDCGSITATTVYQRTFSPDAANVGWSLSAEKSSSAATTSDKVAGFPAGDLHRTARVFQSSGAYTFQIMQQGRHFIRLYFLPFVAQGFNLTQAEFSVTTQDFTLLSNFKPQNSSTPIFKEYLVGITSSTLLLSFSPSSASSFAFVNAIEVVSAPDNLLLDTAQNLTSLGQQSGLNFTAMETVYRVNMGGKAVMAENDTLWRNWVPDLGFLINKNLAKSAPPYGKSIIYPEGGPTAETAPPLVYATATEMAVSTISNSSFNVTWEFPVDSSYTYFVRLHFCDIVSAALNQLLFNVYIRGLNADPSGFDLSTLTSNTLAAPYFVDFVVAIPDGSGKLSVSIGPANNSRVRPNAILNGLEVMKMNNSMGSLDGLSATNSSTKSSPKSSSKKTILIAVAAVLAACVVAVIVGVTLCLTIMSRRKRIALAKKQQQLSRNWMPLTGVISVANASGFTNATVNSVAPSDLGFSIALSVLLEATGNFDEGRVIGVGGFGKVYRGILKDHTEVAVKRGNPNSQQGMNEFRTEIELLSQLRHRHLVSLIGFCNEGKEMILVYEYMEKGTLRSHLYGGDLPPLSWKQRLEICIGAARGLHYLHTGQSKPIIHRDVKSANILLDGNLRAKVADFGLSKTGPDLDNTHVSTAVKGSFGYLDPEYFRRQQLTEKSDVYSFGVVLLEVLCARPVIDPSLPRDMVNLAEWAMGLHRMEQLDQAIDPRVAGTMRIESLMKFVETVEKCLEDTGARRPSMGDVLWNLECALQLQEAREFDGLNCDNGNDHARDSSPLCRNMRSSELDGSTVIEGFDGVGDSELPGLSMSKVFSQLVKNEGRF